MSYTTISAEEFARLEGLDHWRFVLNGARGEFRAGSFSAAAAFLSAVVDAAEALEHHPDLDMRYPDRVRIVLSTHVASGLTDLDVQLARDISAIADRSGVVADPGPAQAVELAIDTVDAARIRPFWAAVLGYRDHDDGLVDPLRIGPPVWFQQIDEPRAGRGRLHVDVSVPHDVAAGRIEAALAAGGTLVTDRFAPSWWVLADADGNEACICTWQGR